MQIPNAAAPTPPQPIPPSSPAAAPAAPADRVTLSSRPLVALVPGLGPRRDPDQAYQSVHELARSLRAGSVCAQDFNRRLPTLLRDIDAATHAPSAPASSRALLASLGVAYQGEVPQVSVDDTVSALQRDAGLGCTGNATVSIDKEHVFEMHYGSGGGFRGSSSYERGGRTRVLDVEVLQKPGAGPDEPAAIRLRYTYPAFFSFPMDATSLAGKSGTDSLYFVPRRSDVSGLEALLSDRERIDAEQPVATMLADLVNSLDRQSPVSVQNDSRGFGRVGTSYDDCVRMPASFNPKRDARGMVAALLTEQAVTDVLGVHSPPRPAPPTPSLPARIAGGTLPMGALGAAAAGLGYAARGIPGPIGLGVTAGLALLAGTGFAAAVNGEILAANGASGKQVAVQRVKAFALGAVLGAAAGATAAVAATPVALVSAAAAWAASGALVGAAHR